MAEASSVVCGALHLSFDAKEGVWSFACEDWPGFELTGLRPWLMVDFEREAPASWQIVCPDPLEVVYVFACGVEMRMTLKEDGDGIAVVPRVVNATQAERTLVRAGIFEMAKGLAASFGEDPAQVRLLTQGNYWAEIVPWAAMLSEEPRTPQPSELLALAYDRGAKQAFLMAYDSSERWCGAVQFVPEEAGPWFSMDYGIGDIEMDPGETVALETMVFAVGNDPWALLETYGDRVQRKFAPQFPDGTVVSWCSWYPYRLGVTEERLLETARVGAERLKSYGLSIIQADLGWQAGQTPSEFQESAQFPHGFGWISERIEALGLHFGVWQAPYCIHETHAIARDHPDWLIQREDGTPALLWDRWYWEPHGKVYILDLTHPEALDWLRREFEGLRDKGIRYYKADFQSGAQHPLAVARKDKRVAQGGAIEASRRAAQVIKEAMGEGALQLNCSGPEMPGTGHWPLNYVCSDTGNTGFIDPQFMRENTLALAAHLWKNRRWSVIQPSCLCVGLPGCIDEARLRATIAFMSGGQIDIGDTLQDLPEDRWAVLTSVLPPLGVSAKPADLFEPVHGAGSYDYAGVCMGNAEDMGAADVSRFEHSPGSVWHLRVERDWDAWDLVAVLAFDGRSAEGKPAMSTFNIPLALLGLDDAPRWAFEFWGGQFLGDAPGGRTNPDGYGHPGDVHELLVTGGSGELSLSFFGPTAKVLALRTKRNHPWPVGTTFHHSCGAELSGVAYDPVTSNLRGVLSRPGVEQGRMVIAAAGMAPRQCLVDGCEAPWLQGGKGSVVVPVTTTGKAVDWEIRF